jgi:hypothetical protein
MRRGVGNGAGNSIGELIVLQLLFKFVTGQGTDQQPFLANRGCRGYHGRIGETALTIRMRETPL